ncbi:hypothetical protein [Cognatishimia sp.]|uniref:hypothetical protein n=1 Tax=Cognatishimia sp. TaxID=2211648 RepID=UPI00351389D8|nr:hypothetical protein [Cognatishimia sp.]NQY58551.1 hypothetical protein [Cognatishimia sp.]
MKNLFILLILLSTLFGCHTSDAKSFDKESYRFTREFEAKEQYRSVPEHSVSVVHDDENKVTCYIFKYGYQGGLSCFTDYEIQRGILNAR